MSRLHAPILLLAILAALCGAPSVALGAPPNQLTAPEVNPTSGTPATTFVFAVRYVSTAGNPAASVTTSVAGLTLPMALVDGSPVDGRWTVAAVLPAGTWPVAFRALPSKGPQPVATGPTVSVASLGGTPRPTEGSQSETDGASPASTPAPAPAESTKAIASESPAAAITSTAPAAGASTAPPAAAGASRQPAAAASNGAPAAPPIAPSDAPSAAGGAAATPAPPGSAAAADPSPAAEATAATARTWSILLGGLAAVAAVALIGTAALLVGRRRRGPEPTVPGPAPTGDAPEGEILLRRRVQRRARDVIRDDDPVLAAMGLDEPRGDREEREAARRRRSR